eukprot:scaffold102458_cov33-Prasinocladus_malaysianus.AAC.1
MAPILAWCINQAEGTGSGTGSCMCVGRRQLRGHLGGGGAQISEDNTRVHEKEGRPTIQS